MMHFSHLGTIFTIVMAEISLLNSFAVELVNSQVLLEWPKK
jgi:hypothetical protein